MPAETPASLITDWPSFFEQIRRRPAMWLGEPSLLALRSLIRGVELAEFLYDITEDRALGGFPFMEFERWAEGRFNPERLSLDSFSLARRSSGSEEEAFHKWLGWYDRFRAERVSL
jgi:hypothetical protein